ncbi:uncharacterized protein V1510DRAFT_416793 [Dipodascopsis tothii]|uniref:uncharacterized protein n=1 Tax=Dipodascopsis tothii TaxID=44089 RepID=UPI0034CEEE76
MRKPEKRKHLFNSDKPWKHHVVTGSMTEAERKRYSVLFATNRGTLLPDELAGNICDIVVRELWERSRLGAETLAKIWDLVCHGPELFLTEDEFVVGTWLVDQCLYGRKLPQQLPSEVWSGVGRLGIRLHHHGGGKSWHHGRKGHGRKIQKHDR